MNASQLVMAAAVLSMSVTALASGTHGNGHGNGTGGGEPGEASEASRTVTVTMHDNYYEPESIEVSTGETVRFMVENKGALVHEFNIGTASMHAAHQEEMQMMVDHGVIRGDRIDHDMMEMEMDGHSMKHDDPNSVLLEPGESAEIVWKFTESTELEFACNVPGHYSAGMYGDLTVE